MNKRFLCALLSLVLALSFLPAAVRAEDGGPVHPLLADWSAPSWSGNTKGKKTPEKALAVPADRAGRVLRLQNVPGEWAQMVAAEDGDYSFSVDTDRLAPGAMELVIWRYRDAGSDKDLKRTDTLRFESGRGIVTRVIHDVYAGETLFWVRYDPGDIREYTLMVTPGDCLQQKSEEPAEQAETAYIPLAADDGLNGTPVITETPKAGDTFYMGWYEQDNDFTNGRERIEWTVLEVNAKKDEMLVISSLALDCILYHPSRIVVKWADSAIRNWLNFDFALTSLSSGERACIISQKVGTDWDTVTMLDANQIKKYKLDKNGCLVSDYAANKEKPVNIAENGRGCWWVRENQTRKGGWVSFVGRHGKVYKTNYTTSSDNGVRPAMKLSISALKECRLGPDFAVLLGEAVDASNPTVKLAGITVSVGGRSVTTDRHGRFALDLDPGVYSWSASCPDYIDASGTWTLGAGSSAVLQIPLCRKMAENEYRVVLTWGLNPADLDSHLNGVSAGGSAYHVYYSQLRQDGGSALLEWDDTSSWGPETTHFRAYPGASYTFSVHDFTNRSRTSGDAMAQSGAVVVVYHADAELARFEVPPEAGTVWTVFTVRDGELTPVNRMGWCEDPARVR